MSGSKKKPHVMIFFSYENSLRTWVETGLAGRELLLYRKMVQQGYKITLLTYGGTDDYRYAHLLDGIQIIPVYSVIKKKSKNKWLRFFKSFFIPFNLMMKKDFSEADIYKTNQMSGSWVPLFAGLIYHKPLVVRCGYELLRNLLRDEKNQFKKAIKAMFGYTLELMAYTSANRIIISNKSDEDYIKKLFPVKKDKLSLIRNFIDTDHFNNNSNAIDGKERRALFIGRIEKRKNVENLIHGTIAAHCRLDIIGNGENKQHCMDIAQHQNGIVHFMGTFDNRQLPDIIRKYNLFVLPSFYENNPKTLLEAMACAKVVLGTDVEGIRELIDDGVTGFLCKTDSQSIKNAIETIFNTPDEKLNMIAKNARNFVVRECAIEHVFKQETDIYSQPIFLKETDKTPALL